MKPATFASSLRPTASLLVLLPLLLIGWAEQAAANPLNWKQIPPLQDTPTYTIVQEVAKHAQLMQDDPSVRLLPRLDNMQDGMKICCLHSNILDFYLNNILPHHNNQHHMETLRINLSRISSGLHANGCNAIHYHDHQFVVEFRKRFHAMGGQALNKAVGEIDILFAFLQDFCGQPMAGAAMQ